MRPLIVRRDKRRTRSTSCTLYECISTSGVLSLRRLARRPRGFLDALWRLTWAQLGCRCPGGFALLQTPAQRFHQVDDLADSRWRTLGDRDFLSLHLLLDRSLNPAANLIHVGGGI